MQVPLELIFHDVPRSEWSENLIREQAQRLERFSDRIVSCHVTVSLPHRHQRRGKAFRVTIDVRIPPNKTLVVTEEPAEVEQEIALEPIIMKAFRAMERRLKESGSERRRDALRPGPAENRALVVRLFPEEGYGFLRTAEGDEEVYFHRNSVLHGDFPRLTVGTEVRFEPAMGEMGPQASSLQIVNKPGQRETAESAERGDLPEGWRNTAG
jgi:cold shock CspA family protein/ribosome-associated translation inhibitor RaiA